MEFIVQFAEYALTHWKAIDLVMQQCELGMRDLELSDTEWEFIEQLHSILKVSMLAMCLIGHKQLHKWILKDATLFFLHSTPSLATVIPTMDQIDMEFVTFSHSKKLLLSI